MAEWIRNGYECSECGWQRAWPAECYEWIERGDHGYLFKNYAVIPAECPRCHSEMVAVVHEGGDNDWRDDFKTDCFHYTEDHDMGATVPWCYHTHTIIESGKCYGCEHYISKSDVYEVTSQILKERMHNDG